MVSAGYSEIGKSKKRWKIHHAGIRVFQIFWANFWNYGGLFIPKELGSCIVDW